MFNFTIQIIRNKFIKYKILTIHCNLECFLIHAAFYFSHVVVTVKANICIKTKIKNKLSEFFYYE